MSGSGQRSQFRIEPFKHRVELDPKARGSGGGAGVSARTQRRADKPCRVFLCACAPQYAEKTWKARAPAPPAPRTPCCTHRVARQRADASSSRQVLEDAIHEINSHNASGLSFEELYRRARAAPRRRAAARRTGGTCSAPRRAVGALASHLARAVTPLSAGCPARALKRFSSLPSARALPVETRTTWCSTSSATTSTRAW
jgi:hypothetical protein